MGAGRDGTTARVTSNWATLAWFSFGLSIALVPMIKRYCASFVQRQAVIHILWENTSFRSIVPFFPVGRIHRSRRRLSTFLIPLPLSRAPCESARYSDKDQWNDAEPLKYLLMTSRFVFFSHSDSRSHFYGSLPPQLTEAYVQMLIGITYLASLFCVFILSYQRRKRTAQHAGFLFYFNIF